MSEELENKPEIHEEQKPLPKKEQDLLILDKSINELLSIPENESFKRILVSFLFKIKENKPFLDYKTVNEELQKMNVSIKFNILNDEDILAYAGIIDILQGYQDRLVELMNRAEVEFNFLEGYYDHLSKMWTGKFSRLSSDKRREGETEYILHFMFDEREKRKSIYNSIKNVYLNMKNKKDSVNTKIRIYQEVRRFWGTSNLPDHKDIKDIQQRNKQEYQDKISQVREWMNDPDEKIID